MARKWIWALGLSLFGVGGGAFFFVSGEHIPRTRRVAPPEEWSAPSSNRAHTRIDRSERPEVVPSAAAAVALTPARRGFLSSLKETAPPVIDRAYLEKAEVCRGEQNFVHVDAHTPDGIDGFMKVVIYDPETGKITTGSRLPIRQREARPIKVSVQGLTTVSTIEIPAPLIKDCDTSVTVDLEIGGGAGSLDRVTLSATIRNSELEPSDVTFQPLEYIWTFGDGTSQTTAIPQVEHSYEGRLQRATESSYVLGVRVRDSAGRTAEGYRSLTLQNPAYVSLALRDEVDMQVGATAASAAHSRELWIYHGRPQTIRVESVTMEELVRHGGPGTEVPQSAAEVLGFTEIPAGQSVSVANVERLTPRDPNTRRVYRIYGRSADGKRALASFSLLGSAG